MCVMSGAEHPQITAGVIIVIISEALKGEEGREKERGERGAGWGVEGMRVSGALSYRNRQLEWEL